MPKPFPPVIRWMWYRGRLYRLSRPEHKITEVPSQPGQYFKAIVQTCRRFPFGSPSRFICDERIVQLAADPQKTLIEEYRGNLAAGTR